MYKKIIRFLSISALLIAAYGCGGRSTSHNEKEEEPMPAIGFRASDYTLETTSVKKNETLPVLLRRIGLPSDSVVVMVSQLDTLFNPRRMRIGQKVEAYYSGDSLNRKLEYAVYSHSKTKVTVFKCADSLWSTSRKPRMS